MCIAKHGKETWNGDTENDNDDDDDNDDYINDYENVDDY